MNDKDIAREIRWSIEHARRTDFSVRLPTNAWSSIVWHLEKDGETFPEREELAKTTKALSQARTRIERLTAELAAMNDDRDRLKMQVAELYQRHEKDKRALNDAQRQITKARTGRARPTEADALLAGTRADSGEDPAALAEEFGWSSAAVMAAAIVRARKKAQEEAP